MLVVLTPSTELSGMFRAVESSSAPDGAWLTRQRAGSVLIRRFCT